MKNSAELAERARLMTLLVAATLLGGALGIATAQTHPPGQLDAVCAGLCLEDGNSAEFCGQVCWIPDRQISERSEGVDWKCMNACRERGDGARTCMTNCRRY